MCVECTKLNMLLPINKNLPPKICCDNHSKLIKFEDLIAYHLRFIMVPQTTCDWEKNTRHW